MSSQLILVVEESERIRAFLAEQLAADGYEVMLAESRRHALALLGTHRPQLVLADLNGHTLGLLDAVRSGAGLAGEIDPHTPMIVLTSRAGELERVRVFDRGGDDVVSKPFSYPELRGRIRALLRRTYDPHVTPVTRIGALTVDRRARAVSVAGRPVKVSAKEYELLVALAGEPTRVLTKVNYGSAMLMMMVVVPLDSRRTPGSPGPQTLSSSLDEAAGQDKWQDGLARLQRHRRHGRCGDRH